MAIQNRRGIYSNFDPSKMVEGELAVILSGDPGSSTGRSLYVCFGPGIVKRIADYEDAADMVDAATEDVQASFLSAINQATSDASTAATSANTATTAANNAAQSANTAAAAATAAAQGDVSNKTVTFTAATEHQSLNTGDSVASLFGKIAKWLSDLADAAFYNVANNLTTTSEGYVLDARQANTLNTKINNIVNISNTGTRLEANTDINTITDYGRYWSPSANVTSTLSNIPDDLDVGFTLEVRPASPIRRQIIYSARPEYPDIWVRQYDSGSFSAWKKAIFGYVAGDTVNLNGMLFIGHLTGSQKNIYFYIPLPKPMEGVTSAALSGNFVIRHSAGGYTGTSSGQTLQSLGTVACTLRSGGIYVNLALSTTSTYTNNTLVDVQGLSSATLTFS